MLISSWLVCPCFSARTVNTKSSIFDNHLKDKSRNSLYDSWSSIHLFSVKSFRICNVIFTSLFIFLVQKFVFLSSENRYIFLVICTYVYKQRTNKVDKTIFINLYNLKNLKFSVSSNVKKNPFLKRRRSTAQYM